MGRTTSDFTSGTRRIPSSSRTFDAGFYLTSISASRASGTVSNPETPAFRVRLYSGPRVVREKTWTIGEVDTRDQWFSWLVELENDTGAAYVQVTVLAGVTIDEFQVKQLLR